MAGTAHAGNSTRIHWGGAQSDTDIHLEVYKNQVDTAFQYNALFTHLSTQRTTVPNSNNYRIDRMGTSTVKSRTSGVALEDQRVANDKLNIIVEVVLYIRNPIDYQDDWTAPDRLTEMGQNNGSEFAGVFDEAHIIQLQKARGWKAPVHLKPAFNDGIEVAVNLAANATTQAALEANAIALERAHKKVVETLITRKVPLSGMVTLVTPAVFSELTYHPKLLNADFTSNNGDFADRRVARMNGINIVECVEFPTTVGTSLAGGHHPLSTAVNSFGFDATADDLKGEMIVFDKTKTLVTVEAKPFTSTFWDDKLNFSNVLDCYAMYTVGVRRPDTAAVVTVTRA